MSCMRPALVLVMLGTIPAALASDVRVQGQVISETTGEPPLSIQSNERVPSLNADMLDGLEAGDFATAGSGAQVHWKNLTNLPVTEINQDCATAGTCTANDSAGFPVTIDQPGSYRLASNLNVPQDTTGIKIQTPDVSLNLNGFAIIGNHGTSGIGIDAFGDFPEFRRVTIQDGTIRSMGSTGIITGHRAHLERLRVENNGGDGIDTRNGSKFIKNTIMGNQLNGIDASDEAVVFLNSVEGNTFAGITTGGGSTIVQNTSTQNSGRGISAQDTSVLRGNTVRFNGADGIEVAAGSTVIGNSASANSEDGISASSGSTVIENTARNNTNFGLNMASDAGYEDNVVINNNGGSSNPQVSGGIELGTNLCGTNTTCP